MRGAVTPLPPIVCSATSVAFPAVPFGRPATLLNLVQELDRTQWSSPEEIRAAQLTQLASLAHAAARTTPSFRDRLQRAALAPADLRSAGALERLPVMTRDDLIAAGASAFASAVPAGHGSVRQAKTSGSVGTAVTVRRTGLTQLVWDGGTIRDHLWRGLDFTERVLSNRFGIRSVVDRGEWGPPMSSLFATGALRATPLLDGVEALDAHCREFGPHLLVVYPSRLDELLARWRTAERPPRDLRYLHTYAEPLPRSLRDAASHVASPVWDTYSCEELGNLSSTCPDADTYHVFAEAVLVEVLDEDGRPCSPGEVGRVVVTDLHNAATPLVRYELGDYAVAAGPCSCGRGLPTLGPVLGRDRNRLRRPDGGLVFPEVPTLAELQDVAPVRQLQVVQLADGSVEAVLVMDAAPSAAPSSALADRIRAALDADLPLRVTWSGSPLPRTGGGKFERFRREDESRAR